MGRNVIVVDRRGIRSDDSTTSWNKTNSNFQQIMEAKYRTHNGILQRQWGGAIDKKWHDIIDLNAPETDQNVSTDPFAYLIGIDRTPIQRADGVRMGWQYDNGVTVGYTRESLCDALVTKTDGRSTKFWDRDSNAELLKIRFNT